MNRKSPSETGRSLRWVEVLTKSASTARPLVGGLIAASFLIVAPGCRGWNNPYPLPNPARVPPPATGSYPATGNYYGAPTAPGTGGVAPQVGVAPAGFQAVAPNAASQVTSANYNAPNVWTNQSQFESTAGGNFQPAPTNFSGNVSSSNPSQPPPSLDWR